MTTALPFLLIISIVLPLNTAKVIDDNRNVYIRPASAFNHQANVKNSFSSSWPSASALTRDEFDILSNAERRYVNIPIWPNRNARELAPNYEPSSSGSALVMGGQLIVPPEQQYQYQQQDFPGMIDPDGGVPPMEPASNVVYAQPNPEIIHMAEPGVSDWIPAVGTQVSPGVTMYGHPGIPGIQHGYGRQQQNFNSPPSANNNNNFYHRPIYNNNIRPVSMHHQPRYQRQFLPPTVANNNMQGSGLRDQRRIFNQQPSSSTSESILFYCSGVPNLIKPEDQRQTACCGIKAYKWTIEQCADNAVLSLEHPQGSPEFRALITSYFEGVVLNNNNNNRRQAKAQHF